MERIGIGRDWKHGSKSWPAIAVLALALVGAPPSSAHDEPAPVNDGWIGNVSASVTAQTGTVDNFSGALDASAERAFDKEWVKGRFTGVLGTSRQLSHTAEPGAKRIQDAQGLYGDWKRTVHERFFWQSASELSRDAIVDRQVRAALATGPGYRAWQGVDPVLNHFDLRAGVGYRYERYDIDTAPGGPGRGRVDQDHFADVIAGFEYRNLLIGDRINFTHTGQVRMPANDPQAFVLTTEVILGIPLTAAWSFRTGFFAEYINVQPAFVNNLTTRTTIGLGYTF